MPKVSPKIVDREKMDQFYKNFWDVLATISNRREAESFFYDFFTRSERIMLAKRFQVALMLIEGCNYETIRENLGVANSTITRVSYWLKSGGASLFGFVNKVLEDAGPYFKKSSKTEKYAPGDLLSPAMAEGRKLVASRIVKRQRRKKVMGK